MGDYVKEVLVPMEKVVEVLIKKKTVSTRPARPRVCRYGRSMTTTVSSKDQGVDIGRIRRSCAGSRESALRG